MSPWLVDLLELVGKPAATVAVLVYFVKKFFESSITRRLETLKHEQNQALETIKHEQSRTLAILRHNQEAERIANQSKLSVMHEKQADAISEFYRLLAIAVREMRRLTSFWKSGDKEIDQRQWDDAVHVVFPHWMSPLIMRD